MHWTRARRSPARPLARPGLVRLEDRSVPAALFVDLAFFTQDDAGQPLVFNNNLPGQGADQVPDSGLVLGTNAFLSLRGAVEKANATPEADQIYLPYAVSFINPNSTPQAGFEDPDGATVGTLQVTSAIDIIGQGAGLSRLEVTDDTDAATGDTAAVVRVTGGAALTVTGLTVDGLSTFENFFTNVRYTVGNAFRVEGATATFTDVTVQNVQFDADGGIGIAALGPDALVTVGKSKFLNNGRAGVAFFETTAGKVDGSTLIGRGQTPAGIASSGVEVLRSTGVTITNNSIFGHTGNAGAVPVSAAVIVADTLDGTAVPASATLAGNDLFGNTAGVIVGNGTLGGLSDASTATLRRNNIDSNATGILSATTATVDAANNFFGPDGPLAAGNDTESGDNPGGAATSEVGEQVDYRPFLTAAVEIGAAPTATAAAATDPANSPTQTATITFSEPVTGFDKTDVQLAGSAEGGSVTGVSSTDGGQTFTVTLAGFTSSGTVTVAVPAGAAAGASGLDSAAVAETTVATLDLDPPVGTLAGPGGTVMPDGTLFAAASFGEPVTGLTAADFTVTGVPGAKVLAVTPIGPSTFGVTVGGFTGTGAVQLGLTAGAVTDAAGNTSAAVAAVDIGTVAAVAPPAAPTAVVVVPAVTTGGDVVATVVFDQPVTFDQTKLSVSGSAGSGSVASVTGSADGRAYTVTLTGFTQPGTVTLTAATGAGVTASGAQSAAATGTGTFALPVTVPPVASPTAVVVVPAVTTGGDVVATVVFDQPVTFDDSKLSVGGTAGAGGVASVTGSADGRAYTVTLTGFTQPGTVTLTAATGAGVTASGAQSAAATGTGTFALPVTVPPTGPTRGFAVGIGQTAGDTGGNQPVFLVDGSLNVVGGTVPFASGFSGGVRIATADVNGDGVLDVITASGPGVAGEVRVYDGNAPATLLLSFFPFEASFTGGLFVAAGDVTGDGKADIVVTPDVGGGARVLIADAAASLAAGKLAVAGNYFAFPDNLDFRGGARPAVGDVTGDGTPDVIIGAGFGGGPRVTVFDGTTVTAAAPTAVANFFAFDGADIQNLRNGVFISAGDLNGDGKAEVFVGGGPGGGPRVRGLDGAALLGGTVTPVVNFFAGDTANRGGVRVTAKDLDGDGTTELVTAPGEGGGSRVTVYTGAALTAAGATGSPDVGQALDLFGGFTNGAFVG